MHLEELQANDARCARNETLRWEHHTEQFTQGVKKKFPTPTIFLDYYFIQLVRLMNMSRF